MPPRKSRMLPTEKLDLCGQTAARDHPSKNKGGSMNDAEAEFARATQVLLQTDFDMKIKRRRKRQQYLLPVSRFRDQREEIERNVLPRNFVNVWEWR